MFNSRRLIIAASAMALLAGCASPNPYDNQGQASTGLHQPGGGAVVLRACAVEHRRVRFYHVAAYVVK